MTATTDPATTASVLLPSGVGLDRYHLGEPGQWRRPVAPITSRVVYAAAHVVPKTLADNTPGASAELDWDTTMAYRHELWSYGLGVADAMDTAQRGMGLDWAATRELIDAVATVLLWALVAVCTAGVVGAPVLVWAMASGLRESGAFDAAVTAVHPAGAEPPAPEEPVPEKPAPGEPAADAGGAVEDRETPEPPEAADPAADQNPSPESASENEEHRS